MKRVILFFLISFAFLFPTFGATKLDWQRLLNDRPIAEMQKLCLVSTSSQDKIEKAEGYKCMANIALKSGVITAITGNELGGGSIGSGYTDQAVDEAIKYLTAGLVVSPQDVSIHQGRLYVLMSARRYDAMISALKESIGIYKGKDPVSIWISYSADLFNEGQMTEAIRVLNTLNDVYTSDHRIHGNLSAAFAMLKNDTEALKHAELAVRYAPTDPINTWNLGRVLEYTGRYEEAEKHYSDSLKFEAQQSNGQISQARRCIYAALLVDKLKNTKKFCSSLGRGCKNYDDLCDAHKLN